jgi:hypothetical protein
MVGKRTISRCEPNSDRRWQAALLAAFLALLALAGGAAAKKKPQGGPPADLPGHVSYLAWQLRGQMIEDVVPITDQIQELVLDHVQQWLGNRSVTAVELRRTLEAAFAKLRYPTFAKPSCFAEPWKGGTLMGAGYTLGWTGWERTNVVALFEHRDGVTRLAATTHFVPYTDIRYEFLAEPDSNLFRFFIYGFRPGKSQPRLAAILYAYDGQTLTPQWEIRDVLDGKMEIAENKLTLRYLKEDEYVKETLHRRKPPRHEAVYRITPRGLEIETEREIPF